MLTRIAESPIYPVLILKLEMNPNFMRWMHKCFQLCWGEMSLFTSSIRTLNLDMLDLQVPRFLQKLPYT